MIYLDNNATTRVLPEVAAAMMPFLTERFSNPTSAMGQFAGIGRSVAAARQSVARAIAADDGDQLVITSGATEANNLALLGAARANPARRHLVVSAVEHPSVLEVARHLESTGYTLTLLPVNADGLVTADALRKALRPDTLLVSVMLANNESGVLLPVGPLAELVKEIDPTVIFHTDATQAVGKIKIDLAGDLASVDLLSFSAHKFHGPKGTGALFLRDREMVSPIQFGGGQQAGLRSGTENPAGVAGMAMALTQAQERSATSTVRRLRAKLEEGLLARYPAAVILGAAVPRLPNTCFVHLPGIDAGDLVDFMAAHDIAISVGSACAHGAQAPSPVALAMGLSHVAAQQCVRISLSLETTPEEIESFLHALSAYRS
jgi:cysteine desulfurase